MTDQVLVNGLVLHAHHGVGKDEQRIGQNFIIDLVLEMDLAAAAQTDKLVHTASYDTIVEVVSRAFQRKRYRLVEAAGGAVASALLKAFPAVTTVRVTVRKPHAPLAATFDHVGVVLVRCRHG